MGPLYAPAMSIGSIESIWRYPVKSMRGQEVREGFLSFEGLYGDRIFAFTNAAGPAGFPYLTAREQGQMVLHRARFKHPERAMHPPNLADAETISPGVTPISADPTDLAVEVETPSGDVFSIDDPRLAERLSEGVGDVSNLSLLRSERAFTDCRPVSLFSMGTVAQIGEEVGAKVDKLGFRANLYLNLSSGAGFAENEFVGRKLRIGDRAEIYVSERDPRCVMITIDPRTAARNPSVLQKVTKTHGGTAGVYGAVLTPGRIRPGDPIAFSD